MKSERESELGINGQRKRVFTTVDLPFKRTVIRKWRRSVELLTNTKYF